jgi:hypothetical protein
MNALETFMLQIYDKSQTHFSIFYAYCIFVL